MFWYSEDTLKIIEKNQIISKNPGYVAWTHLTSILSAVHKVVTTHDLLLADNNVIMCIVKLKCDWLKLKT